jgi:dihydroorotate dehydrogenase electron transfer subunit
MGKMFTISTKLSEARLRELTAPGGKVIFVPVAGNGDSTESQAASSRGALPEVDRSHPSGSFFICKTMTTGTGQFTAAVAANIPLCREHYRLILTLPRFASTRAGQFIQIDCCPEISDSTANDLPWRDGAWPEARGAELREPLALLRRPFSLAGRRDLPGRVELDIIHREIGLGSRWLAALRPGDAVEILGPLGNAFQLPPAGHTAVLVGGGVGIPPMIYLASQLADRPAVALAGALCRDLLPLKITSDPVPGDCAAAPIVEEFAKFGIPTVLSTDDGSCGFSGYVTAALEAYLDHHAPPVVTIYTCGPELMMKRVAAIAIGRGLQCQVAVERAMACGMGTCQSCCIRVKKSDPSQPPLIGQDWCYRLACTDGPIFAADSLLW